MESVSIPNFSAFIVIAENLDVLTIDLGNYLGSFAGVMFAIVVM